MSDTSSRNSSNGKTTLYVVIALLVILAGVGIWQFKTISEKKQEIASLQTEKVGFIAAQDSLNNYITEVSGTIDEIGAKLKDVRDQQVVISNLITTAEKDKSKKAMILDDITAIQTQLEQDKRDVEDLKAKMQKSNFRIKALEKMVANLQKEINQNQATISSLKAALEEKEVVLHVTRDSLSFSQKVLQNTENKLHETEQTLVDTRNTAYYVIGTSKELEARNVIDRVGFIVKKPSLSSEFDTSVFSKIDVTKVSDFSLDCKATDVKIIPPRVATSYKVEQLENSKSVLKVLDREQFWKVPYLAIVTK